MATSRSATFRRRAGSIGRPIALTAGLAALTALGLGPWSAARAGGGGVTITSYGHSALLISGGGTTVLINPFKAVGCAAGLAEPRVGANLILASSLLRDEGAPSAGGRLLSQPGSYRIGGLELEGIGLDHDRVGGRRFGQSTVWRWKQGGLVLAHLGGTAGRLSPSDRVLMGRPDVLIIGVGGGAKVYDGSEAAEVVRELAPRRVIPVQYTTGKPPANCDQGSVEPFLKAMAGTPVQRTGRTLSLPGQLSDGLVIEVMR
jgi:L-ascorbate metabolism protein UlaG (beta-lactamase superfamily)